ncbi:MAG TPA: hypothetical protein PLZ57_01670 [Pseudobdellovibrionaceae bacterium]|nr:hypothetical protein [Pseudobdellovibrionaceae bacterium]
MSTTQSLHAPNPAPNSRAPRMGRHAALLFAVAISIAGLLSSPKAYALVELKGGYSSHTVAPSSLDGAFTGVAKINQLQSLNADIMANVPLMPVGLGLRHEMLSFKGDQGGTSNKIDWKRTSVIVNKRFIDTGMYLGPIATFAMTNDFKYSITSGNVTTNYKAEAQLNGTLGVEAGIKLLLITLGAEVGYMHAPLGNLKTDAGVEYLSNGQKVDVTMSGPYYRGTIGFKF